MKTLYQFWFLSLWMFFLHSETSSGDNQESVVGPNAKIVPGACDYISCAVVQSVHVHHVARELHPESSGAEFETRSEADSLQPKQTIH